MGKKSRRKEQRRLPASGTHLEEHDDLIRIKRPAVVRVEHGEEVAQRTSRRVRSFDRRLRSSHCSLKVGSNSSSNLNCFFNINDRRYSR